VKPRRVFTTEVISRTKPYNFTRSKYVRVAEEMKNLPRGVVPLKYVCVAQDMNFPRGVVSLKYVRVAEEMKNFLRGLIPLK
jgi:hypothetical protein